MQDSHGTVVFIHGTGVRLDSYGKTFEKVKKIASSVGIKAEFVQCAWGEPLGAEFKGLSLPKTPISSSDTKSIDEQQWELLLSNPLQELQLLTIPSSESKSQFSKKPDWLKLWEEIKSYEPSEELNLLLDRYSLDEFWSESWTFITCRSSIAEEAFEASNEELAEASHALARAVVSQLSACSIRAGFPAPDLQSRGKLFSRLLLDWNQQVLSLTGRFATMLRSLVTNSLRDNREKISSQAVNPIGDVLLYQSKGGEIRDYIKQKITTARPPVYVVAHSLGGIACVDLFALPNPPHAKLLVTLGSQSSFLNEIGALSSLKPLEDLPNSFPKWVNFYDRRDFLSYVVSRIWPQAGDIEVFSDLPFPESHSFYFGSELVWEEIHKLIVCNE